MIKSIYIHNPPSQQIYIPKPLSEFFFYITFYTALFIGDIPDVWRVERSFKLLFNVRHGKLLILHNASKRSTLH